MKETSRPCSKSTPRWVAPSGVNGTFVLPPKFTPRRSVGRPSGSTNHEGRVLYPCVIGPKHRAPRRYPGPVQIAFHASERASLGVEVELTLVDPESGALVSAASGILEELGRGHP